ncbi:hypothetical protein [Escherichia phage vB_EcoM_DE16]|uniref:Uncharacterized protein n=1 Tax=Dompiswa phage TSP7_1 TaxID=2793345 RepID=A0A7T3N5N3_9CAUD|nr:MAG: hypothetical protein M1M20_gp106 [Dompiswa phage TSP7_1]EKD3236847.1 hypothetical protein [Escherichia coli]QPX71973.1 MAG: hypothetical protein [Dompiswa phage TSP7_1]WAX24832.1 hypothetical protein [Escherichia phage vB_EcoM_DE16]
MLSIKPKMITEDQKDYIYKCGRVWKEYTKGNEVIVVTEHTISLSDLFGDYLQVIKIGIDRGLVQVLTLSQVEAEHLDKIIVEF